jgi:signal recognition particle receptor subunit beta
MAETNPKDALVNARIVFWGIDGCGKTANLEAIHAKLRPDHRGEMRVVPTPLDPTVCYEELPIELGEIAGVRTQIRLIAIPSGSEQRHTRKQILDEVNGIVLVVDSQPERLAENLACIDELRSLLADYGRSLDELPFVVQYNKRDLADDYFMEDLHRKLAPGNAPVFETVATETTGVLQTLSTISKRVIRSLRESSDRSATPERTPADAPRRDPEPPTALERPALDPQPDGPVELASEPRPAPVVEREFRPALDVLRDADAFAAGAPAPLAAATGPDPTPSERMEAAILAEADCPDFEGIDTAARQAESLLDTRWERVAGEIEKPEGLRIGADLSIVSVGKATQSGERALRVPLVLGDADGRTARVALTIQLDPLMDED